MADKVLKCLEFSYDSLPNNQLRSCLLYCCLFPEDSEIPITDLFEYWKSEGLLEDSNGGWDVVGCLHRACLLEEDGDFVKIHDMIREMGLWMAGKSKIEEEKNVLVRTDTETPTIEKWKGVKRISLMGSKIKKLSEIPNCPRLQTLLLDDSEIEEITDGYFQYLHSLKISSLRGNESLTKLPSGISSLDLLHLDLSITSIKELPQELKALVNLRYLNLDNTDMKKIPRHLISSFSKLQVLRKFNCGFNIQEFGEGNLLSRDGEVLIEELLCLKYLNLISLTLFSSRAVQNFLKTPNLVYFTHSVCIRSGRQSPALNLLHLAKMEQLKELAFDSCDFEEFKIDSTGELKEVLQSGFRSLLTVSIESCGYVKDLTWLAFAPKLKNLSIYDCDTEEIISVEKLSEVSEIMGELNLFSQLKYPSLVLLNDLKCIYENPLPFPKLKEIGVHDCPKLKKLPLNSSSANERLVIVGQEIWRKELQWEDQDTEKVFSTCFLTYGDESEEEV